MFKVFKSPLKIKTPTGYQNAYGIIKRFDEAIKIIFENNTFIKVSLTHKFVKNSVETLASSLIVSDILQDNKIICIENMGKIDLYDMVDVAGGNLYYTNNIVSHNCEFLGSASTLISTEALKLMHPKEPKSLDTIFSGIKIYNKVEESHNYIISVDPAKDGIDSFSVQVTDITKFPFIQVASAKLDIDYLVMPEHLETLGLYYNEAFIVIENNEGAGQSVADMLFLTYEYPNMYRDRDTNDKKYKKFYGFRTTKKTRPLILNMMKIFIEEGKYIVNDKETINEFFNFIKSDNLTVKFEAEEGYMDDMVMSLALMFAPFMHIKAFDDLEFFLNALHIETVEGEEVNTAEYYSLLDVGGFSDGNEEESISRSALFGNVSSAFNEEDKFNAIRELNSHSRF